MPSVIQCRTLGPVEVRVGDHAAPPELLWRKHLALTVYLARSPGRVRTREHLVGLLWGDKPEAAARHSLNEALRIVRRCCGEESVDTSGGQIRLVEGAVRLDVDELQELTGRDPAAAAALVAGEFMEGFGVPDAWEFENWLSAERSHWRQTCVDLMVAHAASQLAAGNADDASALALRALRLDTASNEACRVAMRAAAVTGDRTRALAVFTAFAAHIEVEIGVQPEPETTALADRIRREHAWRLPPAQAGDRAGGGRRTPLIGRERELGMMLEAWESCRLEGRSRLVFVEGEGGAGKTRLLEEIAARARLDGSLTTMIRAVEAETDEPWCGALGLARSLTSATGHVAADDAGVAHALSALVRVATGSAPVLLAFDDAQWLDRETILALAAILRDLEANPLLVILCAAREPSRAELDELRGRIGRDVEGASLRVGPLPRDALLELARWALPSYDDVELDRVTRRVFTDSAGLPLLAVELLHAVALGLDLGEVQGAWPEPMRTFDHTFPTALPDAITAAVRTGFRKLSTDARAVLGAIAVLPLRVEADVIVRAIGLDRDSVDGALDELEWNRWLSVEARGYTFTARIVRAIVARDMVTPGQRNRILEAARRA